MRVHRRHISTWIILIVSFSIPATFPPKNSCQSNQLTQSRIKCHSCLLQSSPILKGLLASPQESRHIPLCLVQEDLWIICMIGKTTSASPNNTSPLSQVACPRDIESSLWPSRPVSKTTASFILRTNQQVNQASSNRL